jgi:hypothetical protein
VASGGGAIRAPSPPVNQRGYKRIIELSNPSLPGYGIDEAYEQSDQRHWTVKCGACGAWTALEKEFPAKTGQDVKAILPRPDGTFYRACVKCSGELDVDRGEWVGDHPDRPIHGYRISQLFSCRVDPGEILKEYRTTRFPERFYNLKIGIPWADLERRLDVASVLALCAGAEMPEKSNEGCVMGVDTGRELHVVVLRPDENSEEINHVVHLGVYHDFSDLDAVMARFRAYRCVVDGLPETHATRDFAGRHRGQVYMSFFNVNQRGRASWDHIGQIVAMNRTEALDASRAAIRKRLVTLPRRSPIVDLFAQHMTANAKVLDEDEETGAKKYRYIRTAADHFSLAFTYAWTAMSGPAGGRGRSSVKIGILTDLDIEDLGAARIPTEW